jgi:hypothetical protein
MKEVLPLAVATLRTRPLLVLEVAVSSLHPAGGPPGAEQRIGDLPTGSFAGGHRAARRSDWQTLRGDGAVLLDTRIVLRTNDDAFIAVTYTGVRHGPPHGIAAIGRGEEVDRGS